MPDKTVDMKASTRLKALQASVEKLQEELEEHKRAFRSWLPFAGSATPLLDEGLRKILPIDPLALEISLDLAPLVEKVQDHPLPERIQNLRKQLILTTGVPLPLVRIRDAGDLKPRHYRFLLERVIVAEGEAWPGRVLAFWPNGVSPRPGQLKGEPVVDPVFGLPGLLIAPKQQKRAESLGFTCFDPATIIMTHLNEVAKQHLADFLGRQTVQLLLNSVENTHPEVVHDLVPALMNAREVQQVLQRLVRERVSIRNLPRILEALAQHAPEVKDLDELAEHARAALGPQISSGLGYQKTFYIIIIDSDLEKKFLETLQVSPRGKALRMDEQLSAVFFAQLTTAMEAASKQPYSPVMLVSDKLRLPMRRLIERAFPRLAVLATRELSPRHNHTIIACIGLKDAPGNPFDARTIPKVHMQSPYQDAGRLVELWEADAEGRKASDGLFPSATIVSDDEQKLWLELYPLGESIRLPLSEVEGAITQAKKAVKKASGHTKPVKPNNRL